MDSQETPINETERRRSRRSRAAQRISDWWAEWVIVGGGDILRAVLGFFRHSAEWLAWAVRRYLLWPLQDRTAELGAPARVLAAVGAALVVGVGIAAVLAAGSGDPESEPVGAPVAAAVQTPAPAAPAPVEPEPEPTLKGATPVFEPSKRQRQASDGAGSAAAASAPADTDPATATIGSNPNGTASATASASTAAGSAASASTSSAPQSSIGVVGKPAGPRALAVAEDFAGAFVLYETGGEESKVRKAFAATATPELAESLLQRPPRLPANVEVPRAKVVNVVAGPSQGGVYTVSVSLLRVGLTSELRLDLEKLKKEWRVTNVLG